MGLQSIHGKEAHSLFRAGSGAATGNILVTGIPIPPTLLCNIVLYTHIVYMWPRAA